MKRRSFIYSAISSAAVISFSPSIKMIKPGKMIKKVIPYSGEEIPAIGIGSWLTYNIGNQAAQQKQMLEVTQQFFNLGGILIDSSPMYGRSEQVIGNLVEKANRQNEFWPITKVWTNGEKAGLEQIQQSIRLFRKTPKLLQVHNLVDYKTHLKTLRSMKEKGDLKYIGITHYLNSAHSKVIQVMQQENDLDFIQIDLSVRNTASEDRVLPTARDLGIGVIINQPFETGTLFDRIGNLNVPTWAIESGIKNWPAFFLKYIISNPAVTCTIPATTQVNHVIENMEACYGNLPDQQMRLKMKNYIRDNF